MAKWYVRTSGANPTVSGSYPTPPSPTPPSCPGSGKICAINAEAQDGQNGPPIIEEALLAEMVIALNSGADQPNVLLRNFD